MPNPNQRAGRLWEEDVSRFLREHGHPAADTIRIRHPDRGDIGGVEDWTLECKAIGPAGPRLNDPRGAWRAIRENGTIVLGTQNPDEAYRIFEAAFKAGQASVNRFDMAAAVDQLGKARAQTGTPYGAVLRKRRGHGPGDGFAIMPVSMLAGLMTRLAESEEA
jgi:hypothetical protein